MQIPSHGVASFRSFNLMPLVSAAFLLVLFFLLTSQLFRQETHGSLSLPTAGSGQHEASVNRPVLTVSVPADGAISVGGRAVSAEDFARILAKRKAAHAGALEVRIRGDRRVAYSRVEPILLACARAEIASISFSVTLER